MSGTVLQNSTTLSFFENDEVIREVKILPGDQLYIGRKKGNEIIFESPGISRRHASIQLSKKGLELKDLGSSNGTFVNGLKIDKEKSVLLGNGDEILFSDARSKLLIGIKPDSKKTDPEPSSKYKALLIGRDESCDIVIKEPSISRKHARLKQVDKEHFKLEDLNSTNGTFYKGERIQRVTLDITSEFLIGNFVMNVFGEYRKLDDRTVVRLERVSKNYERKTVIKPLSLEVFPKTLTAIMGPSGCGKSTLLKIMNGMVPNSTGRVSLFDLELNEYYDYFKSNIGYVPQDDIVHPQLTVYQSLYYAAMLRLEHLSKSKILGRIEFLLSKLKIKSVRNNLNQDISGGQRKRVCIAIELLSEPLLLLLDEPTSPLDPQSIEGFMSILKDLVDSGTTIIMVTHKPEDLQFMDEVIFLTEKGNLAYKGSTKNYLQYFGVNSAIEVYNELTGGQSQQWTMERQGQILGERKKRYAQRTSQVNGFRQFFWLTKRNLKIKENDKMNTGLVIGQAPVIALLIVFIFNDLDMGVLFMMVVSSIWFGVNNAAREVVKERVIFIRERLYNLYIGSYLSSKLISLFLLGGVQSILFTGIISIAYMETRNPLRDFLAVFSWLWLINLIAAIMGLLVSAAMKTSDKVLSLIPIILIPQLMLSGVITKIQSGVVEFLSYFTFSRWGVEGLAHIQKSIRNNIRRIQINEEGLPIKIQNDEFAYTQLKENIGPVEFLKAQYHEIYDDIFNNLSYTFLLDFLMLMGLGVLLIFITYHFLIKMTR